MSEKQTVNIKQRLVGAMLLVSLGVIFIPLLLNGGVGTDKKFLDKNIPPMPHQLTKVLPNVPEPMVMPKAEKIDVYPLRNAAKLQEPVEQVKKTRSAVVVHKSQQKKTRLQAKKKPVSSANSQFKKAVKPATNKINMAYTLQIASFAKKNNALNLQNKLRKKRFKAYIESILMKKGRIYRLRVGPYLKFKQIANIKKQIEKQFKLKNMVIVKYKS